jgi:hypothetical protein
MLMYVSAQSISRRATLQSLLIIRSSLIDPIFVRVDCDLLGIESNLGK